MENWSFLVKLLFISHPLMTLLPPDVPGPGARRASRLPCGVVLVGLALSRAIMKPETKKNIFINKLSKGNAMETSKRSEEDEPMSCPAAPGKRWEALSCFHQGTKASKQHR